MPKISRIQNSNLSRAGWLLVFEFVGTCLAAFALINAGISTDYIFPGLWLFNLLPAWHIAKAARDLGKQPLLYGIGAALLPVFALLIWSLLNSAAFWKGLEQSHGQGNDEA